METPTAPATEDAAETPALTGEANGTVTPTTTGTPEANQDAGAGAPAATGTLDAAQPDEDQPGQDDGETPPLPASAHGLQVYRAACAPCHGVSGGGMGPQFPALEGNQMVLGDPQLVIQVILSGRRLMPSWRDQLSDAQIAAVTSYIRSAWGNDAPGVTADMVARQRR